MCPLFVSGSQKINLSRAYRKLFGSHVYTSLNSLDALKEYLYTLIVDVDT